MRRADLSVLGQQGSSFRDYTKRRTTTSKTSGPVKQQITFIDLNADGGAGKVDKSKIHGAVMVNKSIKKSSTIGNEDELHYLPKSNHSAIKLNRDRSPSRLSGTLRQLEYDVVDRDAYDIAARNLTGLNKAINSSSNINSKLQHTGQTYVTVAADEPESLPQAKKVGAVTSVFAAYTSQSGAEAMPSTISADWTGNQDAILRKRLAILGSRMMPQDKSKNFTINQSGAANSQIISDTAVPKVSHGAGVDIEIAQNHHSTPSVINPNTSSRMKKEPFESTSSMTSPAREHYLSFRAKYLAGRQKRLRMTP